MNRCRVLILVLASVAALGPWLPACHAQGGRTEEWVMVNGTGEVAGRPNMVEMDLQVSGRAELTADALVKYRGAKKRATDALENLKIDGMTFSEFGLAIGNGNSAEQQLRIINGQQQMPGRSQVEVSSTLRVKIKGIRDLEAENLVKMVGRLIDTAQDAGVNVGPNQNEMMLAARTGRQMGSASSVRFVVSDLTELRERAYEKAVHDGRERALRLAKLTNTTLGNVETIQEVQGSTDQMFQYPNPQQIVAYDGEEPRLVCGTLTGMPVQVKVMMRFALKRVPEAAAVQP